MFRINLVTIVSNIQHKKPEKIVIVKNLHDLKQQASNKMRFPIKTTRLFVINKFSQELITEEQFIENITKNDIYVVVTNKKECTYKQKIKDGRPIIGFENGCFVITPEISKIENEHATINNSSAISNKFCDLSGNVLENIKKAIAPYPKIITCEYPDYSYISFDYDDEFEYPNQINIIHECRGLIVSTKTGKVLARRLHKFFSLDQNEQSLEINLDFTNAKYGDKIDGSLVSPVLLDTGELIWCTRRSRIPSVEEFISKYEDFDYNKFAKELLIKNITPLFEWCDYTRDVGVLHYSQSQLILIAIRHNETGEYLPLESPHCPPSINLKPIPDFSILKDDIINSINTEGIVIVLNNNNRVKLKSKWYVQMAHCNKFGDDFLINALAIRKSLKNIPKKRIWITALINNNDMIDQCISNLELSEETTEFLKFISIVQKNISIVELKLKLWIDDLLSINTMDQVVQIGENNGIPDWLISDIKLDRLEKKKLIDFLIKRIKKAGSNIDKFEDLMEVSWDAEKAITDTNDKILNLIDFDESPEDLQQHVLDEYIGRKLANYFGVKELFLDSTITFSRNYSPDEGKIKGQWEKFAEKYNIWDLRIDLQPCRKYSTFTAHEGDLNYILLLVQYGIAEKKHLPSGNFAGLLIPTTYEINYSDIINGFRQSFKYKKLVQMRRRVKLNGHYKIYCDLDGVLVDFNRGLKELPNYREGESPQKMWQKILSHNGFFSSLHWTSYGEDLWKNIIQLNNNIKPVILTGLPFICKKQVHKEKKQWCDTHLGEDVQVICCNSNEKYKYSYERQILIDDRHELGKNWTSYGGIFIHHVNPDRTLYELKRIFNKIEKIYFPNPPIDPEEYILKQEIILITDHFEGLSDDKIIGVDLEWNPKGGDGISLIQIATRSKIYIIDVLNTTHIVLEQIYAILENQNILKLGFGLDGNDINRLKCNIINLIDIQEFMIDQVDGHSKQAVPSLARTVAQILGKKLVKTKEIQAHNWDERPLTDEQLLYAGCDAGILIDIFDVIPHCKLTRKILISPKIKGTIKPTKNDFDPSSPSIVLYSAIFLTPHSKNLLLDTIVPKYNLISGDKIILKNNPSEIELRGFSVGDEISIYVTHICDDIEKNIQLGLTKSQNILIISSKTTPDNQLNIMDYQWNPLEKPFELRGIYGVKVMTRIDPLMTLSEKIRNQIIKFSDGLIGQKLKFKANELSSVERATIHQYAEENFMESISTGKPTQRKLTLIIRKEKMSKKQFNETDENNSSHRITDPYLFAMLNIITENNHGRIFGGELFENEIMWKTPLKLINRDLIILRGLPGSGKSSIAKILNKSSICSADDYFINKEGEYIFESEKLQKAHDYCYGQVEKYMNHDEHIIIVDNTNTRLVEYKKYVELAEVYEYNVIILEIFCSDKKEAEYFAKRNSHQVPYKEVMKMLARWETDDSAILIAPYHPDIGKIKIHNLNNFNKWLTDNKLYHFNKLRNKTYLSMAVGTRPATYLDISDKIREEFLERYAESGVTDESEPKYLIELVQDKFKLFFDFDYVDISELSKSEICEISKIINLVINTNIIIVGSISKVSNGMIKTGLHIHTQKIVELKEIQQIRESVIIKLTMYNSDKNWESIIDKEVYRLGNGIRMFGSRKVTNNIDKGRIYNYFGQLINNEWNDTPPTDLVQLLKDISITYQV
jgi:predicted kinase